MSSPEGISLDEQLRQRIRTISIIGRQAMGALCFRRYCAAYGLHHPDIDAFINHCFDMAAMDDLATWEQTQLSLVEVGLGGPLPSTILEAIRPEDVAPFMELVQHVTEIGYCDLYGATTTRSEHHLLAALKILDDAKVALPDPTPFEVSSFAECDGWGGPVAPQTVASWQALS